MQNGFISICSILTKSFINFGGDLIVVLALKREGSVQDLYLCGLIGEVTECTEVLNRNESSTQYEIGILKIFMSNNEAPP